MGGRGRGGKKGKKSLFISPFHSGGGGGKKCMYGKEGGVGGGGKDQRDFFSRGEKKN